MSAARKLAQKARATDTEAAKQIWPSAAWRGRHLEFSRDVMGKRTIAAHQAKILNEYYKPQAILTVLIFIVVCTGQKLGKTEVMRMCAAFDFATEPGLNGFVFGPKVEHTGKVFWKGFCLDLLAAYYPCAECMPSHRRWCALVEVDPHDTTRRPERCPKCSPLIPSKLRNPKDPLEGRVSDWLDDKNPERGLQAPDGRSICAYTSRKEGGKGGLSGAVRFYVDESSDVSDEDKRTIDGNLSGGGKAIAFGNMLYTWGWFYRAFKSDKEQYSFTFQLSSRRSPNCRGVLEWSDGVKTPDNDNNERPIPGMATPEGIEANLVKWRGTNYITARIDAKPPEIVEGQLANAERVAAAERRWPTVEPEGVLQFGIDVARMRDEFVIAIRRGNSIREIIAQVLGDDDYARAVEMLFDVGKRHRFIHERKPRLVYDASGPEGHKFGQELRAQKADEFFDVYPVQMAHPPRKRNLFDKRRDELAVGFSEWLKTGSIPTDGKLEADIEATTAKRIEVSYGSSGQKWEVQRVITNDELRPVIGRSPDRRNACELAVLDVDGSEPLPQAPAPAGATMAAPAPPPSNDVDEPVMTSHHDRYAAAYGRRS